MRFNVRLAGNLPLWMFRTEPPIPTPGMITHRLLAVFTGQVDLGFPLCHTRRISRPPNISRFQPEKIGHGKPITLLFKIILDRAIRKSMSRLGNCVTACRARLETAGGVSGVCDIGDKSISCPAWYAGRENHRRKKADERARHRSSPRQVQKSGAWSLHGLLPHAPVASRPSQRASVVWQGFPLLADNGKTSDSIPA